VACLLLNDGRTTKRRAHYRTARSHDVHETANSNTAPSEAITKIRSRLRARGLNDMAFTRGLRVGVGPETGILETEIFEAGEFEAGEFEAGEFEAEILEVGGMGDLTFSGEATPGVTGHRRIGGGVLRTGTNRAESISMLLSCRREAASHHLQCRARPFSSGEKSGGESGIRRGPPSPEEGRNEELGREGPFRPK